MRPRLTYPILCDMLASMDYLLLIILVIGIVILAATPFEDLSQGIADPRADFTDIVDWEMGGHGTHLG